MRYLPKSPTDRAEMLAEIGVGSIADLFATIPEEFQLTRDLNIPRQHSESEIIDRFRAFAENNARASTGTTSRSSSTRSSCAGSSLPAIRRTSRRYRKARCRRCSSSRR
jgi:hypothetical protein